MRDEFDDIYAIRGSSASKKRIVDLDLWIRRNMSVKMCRNVKLIPIDDVIVLLWN